MRRATVAAMAGATIAVGACKNSLETASGSIIGRYELRAVDHAPLPFVDASVIVVRGYVDLRSDGRFTLSQTDSVASGAVSNTATTGTWSLQDNALALIGGAGLQLGIVARDSIRMTYLEHENIYVRP